ncbi:MAG: D-alanyl-D-alanine carboxypeptidase [Alphaproteobacteria bacterium]|nr:MAG: D-alanyl-D-alanine carboxypeptidase [Alphaproteobacteria bacterium]
MKIRCLFALLGALLIATSSFAATIETPAREAIILDAQTGTELLSKNADEKMPPSSMSKLMTAYVVFEQLKSGRFKLEDTFHISEKSWATQGSKMFVDINSDVKIEDLLRGMIIQSGNDACVALAEGVSGSEESFAIVMNETAKKLGLTNSYFVNSNGWPNPNHYMTARDLLILAQHLIKDFPEYMHYYKELDFTYHKIKQGNRNPLLYGFPGADGLKTGHTEDAGYGLVGTAIRDGRRVIMVVNGLKSMQERADESKRLMEWAFREFRNYPIVKPGQVVGEIPVWMGEKDKVSLTAKDDIFLTVANADRGNVTIKLKYNQPVTAPVMADQPIAALSVQIGAGAAKDYPLYASENVAKLGLISRITKGIGYILTGH